MNSPPLLGAYGLTYRYDLRHAVFDELSFEIPAGQFLALLGPNGCGKTTLLKILAGIISVRDGKSSGQIRFCGVDLLRDTPKVRARNVAYVGPDFKTEFSLTAYEAVMLARTVAASGFSASLTKSDREIVQSAMERFHCWEWRDRDLQTLSSGQRQLVSLARGIAQGAPVLLLDEALSQMDLHHQAHAGKMLKQMAEQGSSIVLVSHDVNLASEWADSALLLGPAGRGKIAHGLMRDVLIEEHLKILYPGADLVIGSNPATGAPKVFTQR